MINSKENEKQLNEELLNKLKLSILIQEKNNVKTKKKSDSEMVETIRKIIMLEINKNDN